MEKTDKFKESNEKPKKKSSKKQKLEMDPNDENNE